MKETISSSNKRELKNLDLGVPQVATAQRDKVETNDTINVIFSGTTIKLNLENKGYFVDYGGSNYTRSDILLKCFSKKIQMAYLDLSLEKREVGSRIDYSVAHVGVYNFNRELKGLGTTLWYLSLGLIQKFANAWSKPITHRVAKVPSDGLDPDKWDEVFLPLLEKEGYVKNSDGLWKKVYKPLN
ncbi:MAG: hypothetical protein KBD17_01300 [Candidatus Pacebacteria bacterium]|nr:hypothetical protein [Candidatus Paceibacterota bacterium]